MSVAPYPEFFNDVFGPVMQPGSSSHFAGPCRLGYLAGRLLGERPARIRIVLDEKGSFAGTFGIMAEDKALLGGVLGFLPDDERLFRAFEEAEEIAAEVSFEFTHLEESSHPNAVKFVLTAAGGRTVELVGESTGGGMVRTVSVNGFPVRIVGDAWMLLVTDAEGRLTLQQSAALEGLAGPLGHETISGEAGTLRAFWLDREPASDGVAAIVGGAPGVDIAVVPPLLPVLTTQARKPQLFDSMEAWRGLASSRDLPLWEVALQYEMDASDWSRERVLEQMRGLGALMRRQTRAVYEEGLTVPTSPFKPDFAGRWRAHTASGAAIVDSVSELTLKYAYGAGSGIPGVVVVPGPMGGGAGYIYAALSAVQEIHHWSDEALLHGLFVAAGVGAIAYTRSEPTGEVTGCAGETATCGAMAAAGIVEMAGGTPQQAEDAASLLLQTFTGMPCDPMPGGLSQPCRSRILATTCMAHVFADLAMAGHEAVLPLHQAMDVLDAVGRALPPELLCTSRGGACAAPAAEAKKAEYQRWFEQSKPAERPPACAI